MARAYGEERAHEILGTVRHNTVYYPSLTIKGAIQSIRVARPIAADKTLIESLDLPPEGRAGQAAAAHRDVQPADQLADVGRRPRRPALPTARSRKACAASGNEWVSLHRNFDPAEIGPEGHHRQRHQRDLDAQPVPRLARSS